MTQHRSTGPLGWWRKSVDLVLAQLKQGITPNRLAFACALGLWIGVVPSLGLSTVLCALAALALGLNQAAIQAVNFMVYPLQIVCLFPFFELGARLFRGPRLTIAPKAFLQMAAQHPGALIAQFWEVGVHALAAWVLLGLAVVPLLWLTLRWILARTPLTGEKT